MTRWYGWRKILGGASGSGVTSFNGRTGVVVPETGDYTADQITETATRQFLTPLIDDRIVYVHPDGDDALDGSDPRKPRQTLDSALSQMGVTLNGVIRNKIFLLGDHSYTPSSDISESVAGFEILGQDAIILGNVEISPDQTIQIRRISGTIKFQAGTHTSTFLKLQISDSPITLDTGVHVGNIYLDVIDANAAGAFLNTQPLLGIFGRAGVYTFRSPVIAGFVFEITPIVSTIETLPASFDIEATIDGYKNITELNFIIGASNITKPLALPTQDGRYQATVTLTSAELVILKAEPSTKYQPYISFIHSVITSRSSAFPIFRKASNLANVIPTNGQVLISDDDSFLANNNRTIEVLAGASLPAGLSIDYYPPTDEGALFILVCRRDGVTISSPSPGTYPIAGYVNPKIGDIVHVIKSSISNTWLATRVGSYFTNPPLSNRYMDGLNSYSNASGQVTIPIGECNDNTDSYLLSLNSNYIVDMAVSGLGGLSTGVEAANTTYFIILVHNPSTNDTGAIFDLSSSTPTLPSGYTVWRIIGAVTNDLSSNFVGFEFMGSGRSKRCIYEGVLPILIGGANTAITPISSAYYVPLYPNNKTYIDIGVRFEADTLVYHRTQVTAYEYLSRGGVGPNVRATCPVSNIEITNSREFGYSTFSAGNVTVNLLAYTVEL